MELLKRNLAPILPEAWEAIDKEARRALTQELAGRKLIDFEGPHGWDHAALSLGRLALFEEQPLPDVHVGLHMVQPLVELRAPIVLETMELDGIARGSRDPKLDTVAETARKAARVEDRAIFSGYRDAGIGGIESASPHAKLSLPENGAGYPAALTRAIETLRGAGINGPYGLALAPGPYAELARAADDGFPIRKRIEPLIEGPIVRAPAIRGAIVISIRGGDFLLNVGQDYSVGYAFHDKQHIELYLAVSFTFRVLEPRAAVVLA